MSIKALQDYTYYAKYARYNEKEKRRETWAEAIDRVIEMHLRRYPQMKEEIEWIRPLMKEKRFLGSQRALQYGGEPIEKKHARMFNCCASYCDRIRFFQEAFWLLLCGCGAGFSVQQHHIAKLPNFSPNTRTNKKTYVVPDTIEGWADSLGVLLATYFDFPEFSEYKDSYVEFDFSLIRPKGSPLSSGIGKAPGYEPLKNTLEKIRTILDRCVKYKRLRPIDAYDIVMHASDAVLSGGIRRSATICIFSPNDNDMLKAKTGNWFYENPQRGRSNNSVLLVRDETTREQFESIIENVKQFGEPGFIFADNKEENFNPCAEVSLYCYDENGNSGWEKCNLNEINGRKIKTVDDFRIAAKGAAILGTLQAGYTDFPYLGPISESIVRREALLGVSITGMMDSPEILFNPEIQREMAELIKATNKEIAAKIGINPSARTTCIKPSGCQIKNTLISTKNGLITLDEIGNVNGDIWQNHDISVFTDNGEKVSNKFFVNGVAKTKKITLNSGIELESTLNHKYRVIRNNEYIWESAENIEIGDLMPYSVGEYKGGSYQKLKSLNFVKHPMASQQQEITQPSILDEDLAWFIGLYFGDGSNHKVGIRIHGDKNNRNGFDKLKQIIKNKFDINCKEYYKNDSNKAEVYINSNRIIPFLEHNGLSKKRSFEIDIPLIIRKSPSSVIEAFINGFVTADGCTKSPTTSMCTTSKIFAHQIVIILRAIGQDCKLRNMPPTESSKGNRMRYWIQYRQGRLGYKSKNRPWLRKAWDILDKYGHKNMSADIVTQIEDSQNLTYDIEVEDNHTYIANSYISHNSSSCILGTASGIHPHHAKRYFRRVQANQLEPILQHFKRVNPLAIEKSVWSANNTDDIVTFCVEVPPGAKTKNDLSAVELLEYVRLTQQNWVTYGRDVDLCVQPWLNHNVSNTINVRENEWDTVAKYIYDNRKDFAGVSLLPSSGDLDYQQAPMVNILTHKEIIHEYGEGALFASGLIVDGLHVFDNLWEACDIVLGRNPLVEPEENTKEYIIHYNKQDWIRRVKQFAERYCEGDLMKCTRLLKHVHNWKMWVDLKREYKDVDYLTLIEETNNVKLNETVACAGGTCELHF